MVGEAASGRRCSQRDVNDIRYLRMKGRSLKEIAGKLGVCGHTVGKWVRKHDLDRELTEQGYVRCALRYHFDRNSDRLEDPSLSVMDFVRISIIHDRQGRMLLGTVRRKSQMADEMPRRRIEELSEDELRAEMVRLVLGLETKAHIGRARPCEFDDTGQCTIHGDGEACPEATRD